MQFICCVYLSISNINKNSNNMLTDINPKIPMRDKAATREFYLNKLGFQEFGNADYDGYLMVQKDSIQIHFFEFRELDPKENYGQVYIRTDRSEEHTSELQSLMRISYAVLCLNKNIKK